MSSSLMFTNILKYTTLQKVKISYSGVDQKLQDLRRIVKQSDGPKTPGKKKNIEKKSSVS